MSKYSAVHIGKKLTSIKDLSLSGPNFCIRHCCVQSNVLKQMILYGEAKPHKDYYTSDSFLNSQLQIVLKYNGTVS